MKLLIVAATSFEIEPLLDSLTFNKKIKDNLRVYFFEKIQLDILITGVGMVATAFELGKIISQRYDFALNLGIAGSFPKKFNIGEVINVNNDSFIELGAENNEDFLTIFDLGLIKPDTFPFNNSLLKNNSTTNNPIIKKLKTAKGITVNKVHGNEKSINKTIALYNPDTESMEGASFLYACLLEQIPCFQIRAISNVVEKRNRENWNIPLAIKNLNNTALEILKNFN
jgi:futalosine hydrolase